MKPVDGYFLIKPEDLHWRPSNIMKIPNADFLERTKSEVLGARLWRYAPNTAGTLHKHVRAEEFYFVVEGVGRIRVGDETLTVPKHGGILVGPSQLRQVFNDTATDVLWLIIGGPEELELLGGQFDKSLIYPVDPTQLPPELTGKEWPPQNANRTMKAGTFDFDGYAQEWIAAWNAHDLKRILIHYADDVELISPFVARLTGQSNDFVRGKAALRDYFARGLKAFPTLRFDFIRLYAGVRSCTLEYRSINGLRTAEVMEFDRQGKVRRVLAHYCDEAMEVANPSMKDLKRYI